jgi:Macrocin-O-methyltransferase (TylF)
MNDNVDDIRSRYLDLVEKSLLNAIHGESDLETMWARLKLRLRHPYLTRHGAAAWPPRAQTMIGPKRLRNLRELVEETLRAGVPGDYIEAGIWRGGACIMMRAVLAAYGISDRRVICADSFAGLPRPDAVRSPADRRDRLFAFKELAISQDDVAQNFARYDLLDDQVVFLKGLFKDTLPQLSGNCFAVIRLDGDMYESTMDGLSNLYDAVTDGGFIIIDDYGALGACRKAVHDFLDHRSLHPTIHPIDEAGVWWRKGAAE